MKTDQVNDHFCYHEDCYQTTEEPYTDSYTLDKNKATERNDDVNFQEPAS